MAIRLVKLSRVINFPAGVLFHSAASGAVWHHVSNNVENSDGAYTVNITLKNPAEAQGFVSLFILGANNSPFAGKWEPAAHWLVQTTLTNPHPKKPKPLLLTAMASTPETDPHRTQLEQLEHARLAYNTKVLEVKTLPKPTLIMIYSRVSGRKAKAQPLLLLPV